MAEPIQHEREKPSSFDALAPPGVNSRVAVEVLKMLPPGAPRTTVVLVALVIRPIAAVVIAVFVCIYTRPAVTAGGLAAAATLVYGGCKRALGLLGGP